MALPTPTITVAGTDGAIMEYFALDAPDVPTQDVGWVLVVGGPEPLEPQYVTPTEIAGDLLTMGGDLGWMHYLLRSRTEEMVEALRVRTGASDPTGAEAEMISELEMELAALPVIEDD